MDLSHFKGPNDILELDMIYIYPVGHCFVEAFGAEGVCLWALWGLVAIVYMYIPNLVSEPWPYKRHISANIKLT